jgi:Na+/H+ antiporter NhaD/arsenite permease-like protein
METDTSKNNGSTSMAIRFAVMLLVSIGMGFLAWWFGFQDKQVLSCSIFILVIMATLLFWKFRLAIAFVGIGALLGCRVLDLPTFIRESKLDVILFLVGMMVTVGVLKELGFFTWVIQSVISARRMTGRLFTLVIVLLGAFMACAVDEVTSIVFVATLIFQVCDTLKINPTPFIIIAVLGTNIGSSGTMLGNPVGILIGQKAIPPLSFMDFITWSFPVMVVSLFTCLFFLLFWFKKDIQLLDERLSQRREMGLGLGPMVAVPYRRGLGILVGMIVFIALHHNIEEYLGLAPNTVLIVAPLVISGILMIWRHERARHYIEVDVEWWTLMFFMMLFAVAGTLEHTGITGRIAHDFRNTFGNEPALLTPLVIVLSALGSAFVDNIVFVAAFMPVVNDLGQTPLYWALLMGACFGGNITMIGSTANIVALGMLEKRYRIHIKFFEWLKVGALVGLISGVIAWIGIMILAPHMPSQTERIQSVEHRRHSAPADGNRALHREQAKHHTERPYDSAVQLEKID